MSLPLARLAITGSVRNAPARQLLRSQVAKTLQRSPCSIRPIHNSSRIAATEAYALKTPDEHDVLPPPPAEDAPSLTTPSHVVLPNPALQAYRLSARVLPAGLSEQFAVLNACINSKNMSRAERIMRELYRTRPEEMRLFADVHMYNTFLNGFSETPTPMTKECLAWFDAMRGHNLTPDVNSYAIVLKTYLKIEKYFTARTLLLEMQQETGYTLQDMLKSDFLSEKDVEMFRKLIAESSKSPSAETQELLKKLEEATEAVLPTPAEAKPVSPLTSEATKEFKLIQEDIPEARPTKSVGVKFLQEQLEALRNPDNATKVDPYELQRALENQGYEVALQRLLHVKESHMERGDVLSAMHLTPLKKVMWDWHERTVPMIREEIERCDLASGRDSERRLYGPFLKLLSPEKLSMITMLELLRLHNSSGIVDGMKTARAVIDVGKAVEMEYNAVQMKKNSSKRAAHNHMIHDMFTSGKLFNMAVRKMQIEMLRKQEGHNELVDSSSEGDTGNVTGAEWTPVWPNTIRAKVGSVLTSIFIDAATIPVPSRNPETNEKIIEQIPAFFHTYQYVRGKRVGVIKFSEPLTEMLSREPVRDTLHPRLLPMIVHPRPWITYNSGGYIEAKNSCMRIKDSPEQLTYLQKASEQDRISRVLAGLDVLGSTRWRVNRAVFNVVLEAWNSGKAIADIPPAIDEPAPLPPKPENYDTDPKAKFRWVMKVKEQQTAEKNAHSLRCDVNYKVETARAFLNLPMYFPHNMDFRGRAYPIPPTLNHLGNDLCRGLLVFDEAKPLGERGWRWLKIHLANLYGYDKHSFTERENFTVENMENIFDSVDRPLTGSRWWLKAEYPWQCLATCYEIAEAVRSGKPTEFKSRIPVHQDGTCNGLQHYAALGGDLAGARAVNLAPSDRPADVYTGVAEMVNKLVEQDAKEGVEAAQLLLGKISRKVVKQTVMTNVYGVTFIGAKAQIENRLKERDDIPSDKIYMLSGYLAKKVFASLGEMFNGARKIQDWLTESARRIARSVPQEALVEAGLAEESAEAEEKDGKNRRKSKKSKKTFSARNPASNQMTSVIWTTPLGLPIVQPYRRAGKKQVQTILQTVFIEDPEASRPVNALKQSTAFPPNFIHSLDATHMLMSALACHEKGMTFASVHDSYWTHACDVDEMNKVIRDQFIELHSQPIMQNLYNEFTERYKNFKVPAIRTTDGAEVETNPREKLQAYGFADPAIVDAELKKAKPKVADKEQEAMGALFGQDDDDVDEIDENGSLEQVEGTATPKSKKGSSNKKVNYVWEDLKLLPLPEKGEFDINEVKKSDYFFH